MLETLITGVVAIVVGLISNVVQFQQARTDSKKTGELISYQLESLKNQVEKHNSIIERTYQLEETTRLHDEKFKVVNHRIKDLEEEQK